MFKAILNFYTAVPKLIIKIDGELFRAVPILGQVAVVAAGISCGPVCAAAASAYVTGVTGGNLGRALGAGLTTFVTAEAFSTVGDMTGAHYDPATNTFRGAVGDGFEPLTPSEFVQSGRFLANVAGHAAVGCASAAVSGGSCASGAASAALGAAVAPGTAGLEGPVGLVVTSAAGGIGSIAGGGKFENGAVTAAFGYLFNASIQDSRATHEAAVAVEMAKYAAQGFFVTPNVSFSYTFQDISPDTGDPISRTLRTVVDFVVSTPGFPFPNPQFAVDVKTGDAPLRPNQDIIYPKLEAGTVITPVGFRALQAGFIPGVPAYIQMKVDTPRYPGSP